MNAIRITEKSVYLCGGIPTEQGTGSRDGTMARKILARHGAGENGGLSVRFDGMLSHDITYVGIIQTARASGLKQFDMPYALTNCHNSLCAVGGTINEDDHIFGLSAARKYGGVYVPANLAVIHQYARERMAKAGGMLLGSDSHTRYGALGCLGVGEGGPELVKQLLGATWDISAPEVVLVYLTGKPKRGVGPHDAALALCGAVYKSGFVKNKILEFAGPGVANLSMDFRMGVDVMTTETACLSSVWITDGKTRDYFARHGRPDDYRALQPEEGARYDGLIEMDLGAVAPMIALPFHPSNAVTIQSFRENAGDLLRACEREAGAAYQGALTGKWRGGRMAVDQGVIAGCAGGLYENIREAAAILKGGSVGDGYFSLSVYPPSEPVRAALAKAGALQDLAAAGALVKSCFCGPCFGAGDVPGNNAFSVRHTTRNFPHREGSRPADGQMAWVALMDARSIAATARNGGALTAADEIEYGAPAPCEEIYDDRAYRSRVYEGFGHPLPEENLRFGPNIADWPAIPALPRHLLLRVCAALRDPVTTTDELIPSGETSSYRSNPMKLASFALSRREPAYVGRAEEAMRAEKARAAGSVPDDWRAALGGLDPNETGFGSVIYANCPGDGSAREQAASCQRVLGGCANVAKAYATKRYRSNLINWGLLPFVLDGEFVGDAGDFLRLTNVRSALESGGAVAAEWIRGGEAIPASLSLGALTPRERRILLAGCLMNDYAARGKD